MKAYHENKPPLHFVAILLFILVFGVSCSSTRYIDDDQAIVKKVKVDSIGEEYKEQALNYIQKDIRPTTGVGFNVAIYNIFNTKDGKYKSSNIKPLGEKPPILDSALVEISRTQLEKFLRSKGFFMAKVEDSIAIKDKKASVTFTARPGPAFFVNDVRYAIEDPSVKTLYEKQRQQFTHLHPGMQYDEDSLVYEREQIYQMMRQNGYYEFQRPYVRFEPDSNQGNSKVKVKLLIDNPLNGGKHRIYTFNNTNIVIAPNADGFRDTVKFSQPMVDGVRFIDLSHRFKKGPILRYNFLEKGKNFDSQREQLTYDRLYQLNVFKNVKIDYVKTADSSDKLDPVLILTPQKRMSNRIEGEVPFNAGIVGFNLSNTYTNNNIFGGAERFEFQVKGGLQSRLGSGKGLFQDIYQRDFSLSSGLTFPRLMVPFYDPVLGKNGMPHTTFSASYLYALQKDVLTRRLFITSVTYDWVETTSKIHSLTPLNFEYRFGNVLLNADSSFLANNILAVSLLDRKNITLGIKYGYTLNANKLNDMRSFTYFRGTFESAGNMLYAISKLSGKKADPANDVYNNILGLPYNQFVRPEIDVRYYKKLGARSQLVSRLNMGIGYAFGNSTTIPFEKAFFAGGSTGVRAWQARTLGPGNYNRKELGSNEARSLLFGIDQLGSIMAQANIEYRFGITNDFFGGKLNGATFLDFGNIWEFDKNAEFESAKLDFKHLGDQVAVGTGFGLRYDVQFFVFRFDLGLKVKDPQFTGDEQWVIGKFLSGGKAFKDNYTLTNGPDKYRFMQYNFGIGMPF